MTGVCASCGEPTSKKEQQYFRHSIAHIFPKKLFKSIMYHPLNWIELCFWNNSCHSNFDNGGIDGWPHLKCWNEIRRRFFILEACMSPQEKSLKFFSSLKELILKYG
jgi:hypothetical protein